MNIPNIITLARICLVPLIVWAITADELLLALVLFVSAGVSDAVDGFIARTYNQKSELGAYLDPLADKALLVSIYITLGITGLIPRWIVILVVFRDILIVSGVMLAWLLDKPLNIQPLWISKLTTLAQIVFATTALAFHGFGLTSPLVILAGMAFVAVLTVASALIYLSAWLRHMAGDAHGSASS